MGSTIPRRVLPWILVAWTAVKLLLIPTSVYRSTDFDVHRNWLAVTRHLPLSQWYYDDANGTTVHTLDYPPSFAYFEALLSRNPATDLLVDRGWLDERCLALLGDDENDPSAACVAFQRVTVVLSDAVLIAGAAFASRSVLAVGSGGGADAEGRARVAVLLVILNPGLLLLDHVHFQYNGMLLGLLLLSIGCLARGARDEPGGPAPGIVSWDVAGAALYALLLTMKHLYLTLAPLYFAYLLRHRCFVRDAAAGGEARFDPGRFAALAAATGSTLLLPFVPFAAQPPGAAEQLAQMARRLFPFQRGLVHDYWAANVWALYLFADKCLRFVLRRIGSVLPAGVRSIVPEGLPDVPPAIAALCLLMGLLPACFCAWRAASVKFSARAAAAGDATFFVRAAVFCSFSGFMLAYHVHEKAIMTAMVPLSLLATTSRDDARLYLRTFALGHFGLLPLLFRPEELTFKVASYVVFGSFAVWALEGAVAHRRAGGEGELGLVTPADKAWMFALGVVLLFMEVVHPLFLKPHGRMEFLPLMATSVVCAVGLVWCWIQSGMKMLGSVGEHSVTAGDESKKKRR